MAWGPVVISAVSRRPCYTLAFTSVDRMYTATLDFDFRIMRYNTSTAVAALPASSFLRSYTCGIIDPGGNMILAGTTAGEIAVYSLNNQNNPANINNKNLNTSTLGANTQASSPLYKTALLAASNGVHAVVSTKAPIDGTGKACLYVGGGDGTLRCFVGKDLDWACINEAKLQGRITSISIANSGKWMLVGTGSGHIYRVSFGNNLHQGIQSNRAAVDLLEASHTSSVSQTCFHPTAPDAVTTVSSDMTLRLWNLNTYGVTWGAYATTGSHPNVAWITKALEITNDNTNHPQQPSTQTSRSNDASSISGPGVPCDIYSGYADGTLRAYSLGVASSSPSSSATIISSALTNKDSPSSGELWRVNAHRGGVTCVSGNRAIVIAGGNDGRVTVWSRRSHDLLLSFNDHTKNVIQVLVDVQNPELVYSIGMDRIINTYSLRAERRIKQHALPQAETTACAFTSMTQLSSPQSEREILAATTDGRIFIYDTAIPDMHVGIIDVLALLASAARAAAAVASNASTTVTPANAKLASLNVTVPRPKPGQSRADMRINAIHISPSGAYVAIVTQCGRLIVLQVNTINPTVMNNGGRSNVSTSTVPTFTDLSGTIRPSITSPATYSTLAAFFHGSSTYTDVRWAPDEKQLLITAADGCISIFNWYGTILYEMKQQQQQPSLQQQQQQQGYRSSSQQNSNVNNNNNGGGNYYRK